MSDPDGYWLRGSARKVDVECTGRGLGYGVWPWGKERGPAPRGSGILRLRILAESIVDPRPWAEERVQRHDRLAEVVKVYPLRGLQMERFSEDGVRPGRHGECSVQGVWVFEELTKLRIRSRRLHPRVCP